MPPTRRHIRSLCSNTLTCLLVALLSACGGRAETPSTESAVGSAPSTHTSAIRPSVTRSTTEQGATTSTAAPTRRGVLLPGLAGENAYEALQNYVAGDRSASLEKGLTATRPTSLNATLDLAATVGQVNAALDAVGARVVSMRPGHKTLAIELMTQGEVAATQAAAARLIASRAFQWVQGPGLPAVPVELTADPAVSEPPENLAPRS